MKKRIRIVLVLALLVSYQQIAKSNSSEQDEIKKYKRLTYKDVDFKRYAKVVIIPKVALGATLLALNQLHYKILPHRSSLLYFTYNFVKLALNSFIGLEAIIGVQSYLNTQYNKLIKKYRFFRTQQGFILFGAISLATAAALGLAIDKLSNIEHIQQFDGTPGNPIPTT